MYSLYAVGQQEFHIGVYNMKLEDAIAHFKAIAQKHDVALKVKQEKEGKTYFSLPDLDEGNSAIIQELAEETDIGGDAPSTYYLKKQEFPEGYTKAGGFVD